MKTLNKLFLGISLLVTCLTFASCDQMIWNEADDRYAASVLQGDWYVRFVNNATVDCPYYEGDRFIFNGRELHVIGDGGMNEFGLWDVENRRLFIDFNNDGRDDIEARIVSINNSKVVLNVNDYTFRTTYQLGLERGKFYYNNQKHAQRKLH